MPPAMIAAPATRHDPSRSFSKVQPITAANNTEVSRSAAIAAIGAAIIAHNAIE